MDKNGTLELNLNNLCRVCLTENENIKNILTDHAKEASLMEMFNKLSDYKVLNVYTSFCCFLMQNYFRLITAQTLYLRNYVFIA